jgi:hypothetical protein
MPLASSLLRDRRGECIGNIRGRDNVSIDRPINKTHAKKPFRDQHAALYAPMRQTMQNMHNLPSKGLPYAVRLHSTVCIYMRVCPIRVST